MRGRVAALAVSALIGAGVVASADQAQAAPASVAVVCKTNGATVSCVAPRGGSVSPTVVRALRAGKARVRFSAPRGHGATVARLERAIARHAHAMDKLIGAMQRLEGLLEAERADVARYAELANNLRQENALLRERVSELEGRLAERGESASVER